MQKSSMLFVITLLLVHAFLATPSVLATPTVYQCPLPTQPVGNGTLKAPVSPPKSGDFVINFQRSGADSTQATINLSEIKDVQQLSDRIAKAINDEATQRAPKMAAVRERGLDEIRTGFFGGITVLSINEVFRFLMVYDPDQVQLSFQSPGNYVISCEAVAPIREVPDLSNVTFTNQPKLLFVGFPDKVKSDVSTTIVVAYTDKEDDVNGINVRYRGDAAGPRVAQGFGGIGLQVLPIPSPFGAGLKAIKFKLQVPCDTAQNFEATATATDDKGNTSDPLTFKFACEP